jgi:tetratricopeptide (TPR) repeat protein
MSAFTSLDQTLAQRALQQGWVSPEALGWCQSELSRRAAAGSPTTLGSLLVECGWLTPRQLQRATQPPDTGPPPTVDAADSTATIASGPPPVATTVPPPSRSGGQEPAAVPQLGVSHLEVLEKLAQGGMGSVFAARDTVVGRTLAVKVAPRARDAAFLEEVRITGQLEHPNIIPIHEVGRRPDGAPFFTMKLVEGVTLTDAIRDGTDELRPGEPKDLARYLEVFLKICDAIAFAHSRQVIHRDLKPDNVMLGAFGEVLVMDWGIARAKRKGSVEGRLSMAEGEVAGTPGYMAPEQAAGEKSKVGPRTDVYGLGAILYEILTGSAPIKASGSQIIALRKVMAGDFEPPSQRAPDRHVPRELEATALKALATEPRDRYADVRALQDDVRRYLDGRSVSAVHDSFLRALVKLVKRNKALSVVSLGAAAALATVIGLAYSRVVAERNEAVRERNRALQAETAAAEALEQQRLAEAERRLADAGRLAAVALQKDLAELELLSRAHAPNEGLLLERYDALLASTEDEELRWRVRLDQARCLTRLRRIPEAKRLLRELRQERPRDRAVRRALLELYLANLRRMTPDMRDFLIQLAEAEPDGGVAHLLAANRERDLDARLQQLNLAIAANDRLSIAYVDRAYVRLTEGRTALAGAIEDCTRAIEISPLFAEAYGNRGMAYRKQGRQHLALADLDQAVALKPELAYAHRERGRVLKTLRRLEDALASFQQAYSLGDAYALHGRVQCAHELQDPDLPAAIEAYRQHDPAAAEALLRALSADPSGSAQQARQINSRGWALQSDGRDEEALELYRQATELDPSFLEALLNHAELARNRGHVDEALRVARQAQRAHPEDWRAHFQEAACAQRQRDWETAVAATRRAIERSPSGSVTAYLRAEEAMCYAQAGDLHTGRALLVALLEDDPTQSHAHDLLGQLCTTAGEHAQALEHYQAAIRLGSAASYLHRGKLLIELGRSDEAWGDLTEALERLPQRRDEIRHLLEELRQGN